MTGNHFKVHGGIAGMRVSWQITGIRKDPWAKNNRIDVEEEKPSNELDSYIHPEVYNQSSDRDVQWKRYPKNKRPTKHEWYNKSDRQNEETRRE